MSFLRKRLKHNRFSHKTSDPRGSEMGHCSEPTIKHSHFTENTYNNRFPDENRIQELLVLICQKRYKYYVKGGFLRARSTMVSPVGVAKHNKLPLEQCLFEVKDPRIEMACIQAEMEVVTPSSKIEGEERARRIYTWRADEK
ncbi:hypothetical protein I6M70_17170 [Acinetobacter pittii]|uniref:hypothetical protein n=1 Tax=Acinetobacter pittii TaxID=48296 RepID=UPI0019028887|nr:hypothetical protein [Acinetobacter pittii]MBJ8481092.1 hypothetical protein [Acinetobacter pittii]